MYTVLSYTKHKNKNLSKYDGWEIGSILCKSKEAAKTLYLSIPNYTVSHYDFKYDNEKERYEIATQYADDKTFGELAGEEFSAFAYIVEIPDFDISDLINKE